MASLVHSHDDKNAALRELLSVIIADPVRESEWLELLSQLEFVGCRKIVKAVPFDSVDLEVLQHVAEEASHAFLLKSLVVKSGVSRRSWLEAPLAAIGWRYFQSLDQRISHLQSDDRSCYPAVSWVIERRVLELYPLYREMTRNTGARAVLSQILAQEERHGQRFSGGEFADWFRERALGIEQSLWDEFIAGALSWARTPRPDAGIPLH